MAGTLTISTLSDGTNSTSSTNCIQGSAKAWVNFNGVTTVTINAFYNVSSITRNSGGNYTINFTNALTDANYTITSSAEGTGSTSYCLIPYSSGGAGTAPTLKTTTQCRVAAPQDVYCGSVVFNR